MIVPDADQHLWGDVENIDWKVMLAAHKATTTGAHILRMKGMHAMFATNATKFLRGTIQAEEIHCTMCGRATESWWHLAGICTHPTAIHIRKEMVNAGQSQSMPQ
jgi:hypothetical protein